MAQSRAERREADRLRQARIRGRIGPPTLEEIQRHQRWRANEYAKRRARWSAATEAEKETERARQRASKKKEWTRNKAGMMARRKVRDAARPEQVRAQRHDNYVKHKVTYIAAWRRRRYGVTREQWLEMFEKQGRCCAVCGSEHPGSKVDWATDHNHETGVVRGILCHPCNCMLGHGKDSPDRLRAGAAYLERPVLAVGAGAAIQAKGTASKPKARRDRQTLLDLPVSAARRAEQMRRLDAIKLLD